MEKFQPELVLEKEEAASLAAIMSHPGYKVIHKICNTAVSKFAVAMLNATGPDDVVIKHNIAKAAAQFYTDITNTMNEVVYQYVNSFPNDKPIESAENLDIGEYTDPETFEEEEPLV